MEIIAILCAILILIVAFIVKGIIDQKRTEKQFIENCKRNFGGLPLRTYREGTMEAISYFFKNRNSFFFIDDITWNDLDMDSIFKRINYNWSSAGEEYLYYRLRTPFFEQAELDKFEEKIQFFSEREQDRLKMQVAFAKIGRTGKHSIFEYLDRLDILGKRSNWKHYFAIILMLFAVGIMMVEFSVGLVLLSVVLIYNIITYFQQKSDIDPYITSFEYVLRMLQSVKLLEETEVSVWKEELEELHRLRMEMNGFVRFHGLVSVGNSAGSSNPLDLLIDYLKFILHIDIIRFNQMLDFLKANRDKIERMVELMGYMECMVSISCFRASIPQWCQPVFSEERVLRAEDIYHFEIPDAVRNDLFAERSVLLTGSNASGKSTFLKTVAINAILAQTIHTCSAKRFETCFYKTYTSMALRDNLQRQESYYMVEIKSMKRILDAAKEEGRVLCFVDEVLRGTNTVERISASTEIMRVMAENQVMAFAATHDIELTLLLKDCFDNYHFEERMEDNDVVFEYKLLDGPATTRNAIKLLRMLGYEDVVTDRAEQRAERFLETGQW